MAENNLRSSSAERDSAANIVDTHPAWEDWLGIGLGILMAVTPYLAADEPSAALAVQLATTFLGLMIVFTAITERLQVLRGEEEPAREWEEVLQALAGAVSMALPFLLGYAGAGSLRFWHFAIGAAVFLLAIFELRRDYVGDMRKHGWWQHS